MVATEGEESPENNATSEDVTQQQQLEDRAKDKEVSTDSHRVHHHHPHPTISGETVPHVHQGNHIYVLKQSPQDDPISKPKEHTYGGPENTDTLKPVTTEATKPVTGEKGKQEENPTENKSDSSAEGDKEQKQDDTPIEKAEETPTKREEDKQDPNHEKTDSKNDTALNKKQPPVTINIDEVKGFVNEFQPKRSFLGTIIYNPTTTWGTLQISQLPGLREEDFERLLEVKHNFVEKVKLNFGVVQYIPMIPPLPPAYVNFTLTIKIPQRFLEMFKLYLDAETMNRDVWGGAGGIYTDDSNIIGVLGHLGLFNNSLDLSTWNPKWSKLTHPTDDMSKKRAACDDEEMLEILRFPILGDLSVDILLLPPMPAYYGYYANGINTRSWTHHRGLSYAVYNAKWESPNAYLRDKASFKRYQAEMAQDKRDFAELPPNWKFSAKQYHQIREKYKVVDGEKSTPSVVTETKGAENGK